MKKQLLITMSIIGLVSNVCAIDVKKAVSAAGKIPKVAKQSGKAAVDALSLAGTTIQKTPDMQKKINTIKTSKNNKQKIGTSLALVGQDLLPIFEKMAQLMASASKPIHTVGKDIVQPFKKRAGKRIAVAAQKTGQAAKEIQGILKELQVVWPEIVAIFNKEITEQEAATSTTEILIQSAP